MLKKLTCLLAVLAAGVSLARAADEPLKLVWLLEDPAENLYGFQVYTTPTLVPLPPKDGTWDTHAAPSSTNGWTLLTTVLVNDPRLTVQSNFVYTVRGTNLIAATKTNNVRMLTLNSVTGPSRQGFYMVGATNMMGLSPFSRVARLPAQASDPQELQGLR
jgi:hypothetical protein